MRPSEPLSAIELTARIKSCESEIVELRSTLDHFGDLQRRTGEPDSRLAEWQDELDEWQDARHAYQERLRKLLLQGATGRPRAGSIAPAHPGQGRGIAPTRGARRLGRRLSVAVE